MLPQTVSDEVIDTVLEKIKTQKACFPCRLWYQRLSGGYEALGE